MAHKVFCPQQVAQDRYIVLELRSFLWFKWWRPIPDLYVDYDRLLVEVKNAKLLVKRLEQEEKQTKQSIDDFLRSALSSYQGYSRSLSSKKRKTKRVGTTEQYNLVDLSTEVNNKPTNNHKGRGPPSSSEHTASDRPPQGANNSNNQKGGQNKGSGGGR